MTVEKDEAAEIGRHIDTRLVNAGRDPWGGHGFINPPVYHGSTVLFPDAATLKSRKQRYTYGLRGSPTIDALQDALTELEGADGTVLVPSGLAAVTVALLAVVEAGDHLLVVDTAYQPTRSFCDGMLAKLGVETEYYDPLVGAEISRLMRPNTRAVLTEAPGSQTFEMQDIPAIVEAAHAAGALVLMDNTWATPLLFRALDFGVDISIQAGTKYIGGHSDVLIGSISARGRAWGLLARMHGLLGAIPGPDDIFLTLRGMRTMGVRLKHHMQSALKVARWLEERTEVARVLHPALESDPGHAIWKRDFKGACGLFGFVLDGASDKAADAFVDALTLFGIGYSWGGFESLVVPCDPRPYRTATTWRAEGPLIRLHVGLEDVDDLIADLSRGFEAMRAAGAR